VDLGLGKPIDQTELSDKRVMLIGRLFLIISIFSAFNVYADSIEDIIQRDVVNACDKINKPKMNSSCPLSNGNKETRADSLQEAAESANVNLKRCDPNREDLPPDKEMKNVRGESFPVSTLKLEEAEEVFQHFRKQQRRYALNEQWVADRVCAQRSQIMATDLLNECRIRSAKAFIVPSTSWMSLGMSRNTLEVEADGKKYRWDKFHVANVIYVEKDGKSEPYVMDPILSKKIIPLAEWEATVKKSDPSAETRITSGSVYRLSQAGVDDPSRPPRSDEAIFDLEQARHNAAILRKYGK
jgi:hypothetical protein